MNYRYLRRIGKSKRSHLIHDCDRLFSRFVRLSRGEKCEVHGRPCPRLGVSHIFNKRRFPRLRYAEENIIVCGWFCSHFYTHHDPGDPRALEYDVAVKQKLGENWKDKLHMLNVVSPPLTTFRLEGIKFGLQSHIKMLEER